MKIKQHSIDEVTPWESIEQLFKAMNNSLDYCVLRNT